MNNKLSRREASIIAATTIEDGDVITIEQTEWYPSNTKPLLSRPGPYATRHKDLGEGFSYWNGKCWSVQFQDISEGVKYGLTFDTYSYAHQDKAWRGVTKHIAELPKSLGDK